MTVSLSTSSYNTAAQCLKRYEYRNVHNLVPRPRDQKAALRRGIWIHRLLEVYYSGQGEWEIELFALEQWAREHGVEEKAINEVSTETRTIFENYLNFWAKNGTADDQWEPVAQEQAITVSLNGLEIRATIDLIVRNRRGLWIVEHKSTSQIPSAIWRAIDPQTLIQLFVAIYSGVYPGVQGIIFNYLSTKLPKVPQVKGDGRFYANTATTTAEQFEQAKIEVLTKWEGPASEMYRYLDEQRAKLVRDGEFYQRYPVERPPGMLRETLLDLYAIAAEIEQAQRTGHYRRAFHPITCERFCDYSRLCAAEYILGGPSETNRETDFVIETEDLRWMGRKEIGIG